MRQQRRQTQPTKPSTATAISMKTAGHLYENSGAAWAARASASTSKWTAGRGSTSPCAASSAAPILSSVPSCRLPNQLQPHRQLRAGVGPAPRSVVPRGGADRDGEGGQAQHVSLHHEAHQLRGGLHICTGHRWRWRRDGLTRIEAFFTAARQKEAGFAHALHKEAGERCPIAPVSPPCSAADRMRGATTGTVGVTMTVQRRKAARKWAAARVRTFWACAQKQPPGKHGSSVQSVP